MSPVEFIDAVNAGHREFHFEPSCTHNVGPRGGVFEHHDVWRANGNLKRYKREPLKFVLPTKHGMRAYAYIDNHTCVNYCLPENCRDGIAAAKARDRQPKGDDE